MGTILLGYNFYIVLLLDVNIIPIKNIKLNKNAVKQKKNMLIYDIPHGLCMCCSLWLEFLFCLFLYAGSFSLSCLSLKPLGWRRLLTIQQCSFNEYILCIMHIILGTWHVVMSGHKSVSLRSFIY